MLTWKNQILAATTVLLLVSAGLSECSAQNQNSQLQPPPRHIPPPELRPSAEINRRYQDMLKANRAQQNLPVTNSYSRAQPNGGTTSTIRPSVPQNLIPPRNSHWQPHTTAQQPAAAAVQQPGATAPHYQKLRTQQPADYRSQIQSQTQATSHQSQRNIAIGSQRQFSLAAPKAPLRGQVQHQNQAQVSEPVFYDRSTNSNLTSDHRVIQTSQPQERRVIKGSSRIPATDEDDSKVTRARIILQDTGDPFGQAPSQGSTNQADPFADPIQERNQLPQNQSNDPFADPPQDGEVPQRGRDPFADPPGDLVPQQDTRDPFRDPPAQLPDVDTFPDTPGDITPGQFNPNMPDNDPNGLDLNQGAPETGETKNDSDRPKMPREILGPFKSSRGFEPTPILPAPPRREFGTVIQQQPLTTFDPELLNPNSVIVSQDQPSFFGSAFDKTQIYEGISQQPIVDDYQDQTVNDAPLLARRKVLDRFNHLNLRRLCQNSKCLIPGCRGECSPGQTIASADQGYESETYFDGSSCVEGCFEPFFYVSVFGGYTQLEDMTFDPSSSFLASGRDTVAFNDGFGIGLAIGQFQGPNLRTEIELTYRNNQADTLTMETFATSIRDIDGSAETLTGMFNVLWDFNPRPIFKDWQPYAGIGLGFTILDVDVPNSRSATLGLPNEVNESQSSFAYQLMAGISKPLTLRTDGFVEYRYLNAESVRLVAGSSAGSVEYETEDIFFGIRMHF